jgi:hypothetical protein
MIAQNSTAGYAGTYTRDYRGPNNLTDWYLGSGVEMNAMNTYTSNPFHAYWTSTQSNAELAQYKISGGTSGGNTYKSGSLFVRPIRSF